MNDLSNQSLPPMKERSSRRWHVLTAAALGIIWFDPSGGVTSALLAGLGMWGVWNFRQTVAAWKNPSGVFFAMGVFWSLISVAWSYYAPGSARDLVKAVPLALAVMGIPSVFDRPARVWFALLASAGWVTLRLAIDLIRIWRDLGWSDLLAEARFHQVYLYTHPNVSSMMAGLCVLILISRCLAGMPKGLAWRGLVGLGIALNLAYLLVMASRGPQVALAAVLLLFPVVAVSGWRSRLWMLLLAALLGAGLCKVAYRVNPRFRDETMSTFNRRDTIWGHAWELAQERPLLGYGYGKKAFVEAVYKNPDHRKPRSPIYYPHTHSYWLMLLFQGGWPGVALWMAGWGALAMRLGILSLKLAQESEPGRARLRSRTLPLLLGLSILYVLVYGIVDFPDHVIRQAQFYLLGLAMALTSAGFFKPHGAAL